MKNLDINKNLTSILENHNIKNYDLELFQNLKNDLLEFIHFKVLNTQNKSNRSDKWKT